MAMIKLERFGKGYLENPYNVDTEERASVSVSVCVCVCVCGYEGTKTGNYFDGMPIRSEVEE